LTASGSDIMIKFRAARQRQCRRQSRSRTETTVT
jgi:hypothetical protein